MEQFLSTANKYRKKPFPLLKSIVDKEEDIEDDVRSITQLAGLNG